MSILIRKKVLHKHDGSSTAAGLCFYDAYDETHYKCQCSMAACGTIEIENNEGFYSADVYSNANETGIINVAYKWMFNNEVISTAAGINPERDGYYTLIVDGNDAKTGKEIHEEITAFLREVEQWENVAVGGLNIYGMAVGDKLVEHIAIGDQIL